MDNEIMQNQYTDLADNIKKGRLVLEVLCREYTSVFCLDFHNSSLELLKLDSAANAFEQLGDNQAYNKLVDNMEIAKFILQDLGTEVTKVWNGKEAVNSFKNSTPGTYDAIDIMMPEMDGYTAAKIIRSLNRDDAASIPIIVMTANAFTEDKMTAINAGMNEHISKPISEDRLLNVLAGFRKK